MIRLLVVPLAIAAFRLGETMMLSVVGDPDFDATLGGPIMQAIVLICFSIGGHLAALGYVAFKAARRSWIG